MKVYVAVEYDWDNVETLGVFGAEEAAWAAASSPHAGVVEWVLDDPDSARTLRRPLPSPNPQKEPGQ